MTRITTIIGRTRPGRNGLPPSRGQYQKSHTRKWAETIAGFDGHVVVTPQYNHSTSGALKNALDYLYAEWNNKAVGFVSHGGMGGVRAVEHLRVIAGELQMANVRQQVAFSLMNEFEDFSEFTPAEPQAAALFAMLDQLTSWANALAPLRAASAAS